MKLTKSPFFHLGVVLFSMVMFLGGAASVYAVPARPTNLQATPVSAFFSGVCLLIL